MLLEYVARANKRTVTPEVPDLADLQTAVRLAATGKLESDTVWARATLGELHLGLGHAQEALDDYEQATADPGLSWFNIRSMFEQVQLFQLLGYQPEAVGAGRGVARAKTGGTSASFCALRQGCDL